MKLLIGSHNPAKIADYKKYLVHSNLELVTLKDLGFFEEPLEIGKTYEENALQKAKFYAERTEYPTLADDGGFEIDFLDGRPGVDSNRWVGPNGTDEDRLNKVLELLKDVPDEKRTARLRFVTVVYFPSERESIKVENKIEGIVTREPSPKRIKGFPYRPIFFLPQLRKTLIELSEEEHERFNYRKAACKELLLKLESYINS
jgi:XTP/dITP diphosphohydrolase